MTNTCIFLGTAGSVPSIDRDNTAVLLKNGAECILVDCPGSVAQKLLRSNIDYRAVTHIILTHEHPDHIYGMPSLLHCLAMAKIPVVRLYCSRQGEKAIQGLLRSLKLHTTKGLPRLDFVNVFKQTVFYRSRRVFIQTVKNHHIKQSFGVKVFYRAENKTLVYSSDTAKSSRLIRASLNCDYLIHDCSADSAYFKNNPRFSKKHTSSKQLSEIAAAAKVKTLIPIHFYGSSPAFFVKIKKELRSNYTGKILIPKDLQILNI